MPRLTAILTASAAAVLLAGCGGDDGVSNEELLESSGFETALDAVRDEAGEDADALRVQVTAAGAEFRLLTAEGPTAYAYSGGELGEVVVAVIAGSVEDEGFPLSDVDPGAVDEIAGGVRERLGGDAALNGLTLEVSELDGEPRWVANAQAAPGEATQLFVAEADGSGLRPARGAEQFP